MALSVILRVGDTSARDVSLNSSGVTLLDDLPWLSAPDVNQQAIQNLGDGNSLGVPSWSNVTESISLHISDSTPVLVAAKVQAIELLLDLARQGTLGYLDDKVYLRVQFDHDSLVWRSQILAAKLEMEQGANQIWREYVRATLIITRRYYFETEAMQSVAVSSGVSSATTGYATVYNADDSHATNRNYFDVAAAQVIGSLPAPAKISIKNTSGATRRAAAVFLGNYVFNGSISPVDFIYRAGEADGGDTTPDTTETSVAYWELDNEQLVSAFRGQFGRWVAVWADLPANTTLLRAALQYRGPVPEVDLALGEQFINTGQEYVQDLGALPIPPGRWATGMGDRLYLAVKAKAASGTDSVQVNWLQIFPSGKGRYRVLEGMTGALTLSTNNEIVDDGPNESVYISTTTGEILPLYRPLYAPLYLWPGRLNRMAMIISSGSFSFEATQPWGVRCEYRPRRISF